MSYVIYEMYFEYIVQGLRDMLLKIVHLGRKKNWFIFSLH